MNPDLGPLDRRIRIEQQGTTDGAYGPQPGSWTTFGTFWATVQEVLPSRGESQADGIRIAERPARVRMRYVPGITSAMRLLSQQGQQEEKQYYGDRYSFIHNS